MKFDASIHRLLRTVVHALRSREIFIASSMIELRLKLACRASFTAHTARDMMQIVDALGEDGLLR